MNKLLQFLFSLLAHAAWRRIGGGGAVPPIKLPRGKAPIPIPVFSSWQLMVMMWLIKKVWQRHGGSVKTRLVNAENPVVRRVGSYVPDVNGATTAPNTTVQTAQASTAPTSAAASPAQVQPAHADYGTQHLDDEDTSLLSSLKNGTSAASFP